MKHVAFDLETLSLLDRRIYRKGGLETVHDARLWAFGKQGLVLEEETVEQAELEGRKLLANLRDSS